MGSRDLQRSIMHTHTHTHTHTHLQIVYPSLSLFISTASLTLSLFHHVQHPPSTQAWLQINLPSSIPTA